MPNITNFASIYSFLVFHAVRYLFTVFISLNVFVVVNAQEDTLIQEKDSIWIIDEQEEEKIIEDIRQYSEKDNFFSRLLNRFMVIPAKKLDEWDFSYTEFSRYQGKIIRDIFIDTRKVFGPDLADTSYRYNLIDKAAEFFHVKTRKWIVRNQLLFKPGEKLAPFELAETERLLRSRNYLFDADITVIRVGKDSVDVIVSTRDLWSLSPGGDWNNDNNSAEVYLQENNFLGLGFTTKIGVLYGDQYQPNRWDYKGSVRFENLVARYLHFDLERDVDRYGAVHKIKGERQFETPLIDIAGGVEYQWFDKSINLITRDTFLLKDQHFQSQDYWIGYGTNFNSHDFQNEYYAAVGFRRMEYQNPDQEMINYFQDNSRFLVKAGYAFRRYHKTRYVIGLGRNEDIPVGQIFTITGGYQHGSYQHKWYAGLRSGYSVYNKKIGYLSAMAEAGSFIYNKGFSEYTYRFDLFYFTNLLRRGRFRFRHFFRLGFAAIQQPNQMENALNLDNEEGIRGFHVNLFGNKKVLLNYEINLFPPLEFLGFNFAAVGFTDVGFLADREEPIWQGRFLSGLGIGLKVRNENLVFQAIQIMLGYYPQDVLSNPQMNLFIQQRDFYDYEQYRFDRPGVVRF
ncbi:MAG: hypothetical protein ACOCXH_07430 [Cyclobacteriaceae bacterium]